MVTRKKYDSQNRVISKAISDDRGVSSRYTYTYKGDNTKPQRVNKHVGKVAELVYQEDEKGRPIYVVNEENNIATKFLYSRTYDQIKSEFDQFSTGLPEDGIFDVKVATAKSDENNILAVEISCSTDEVYEYKFLKERYEESNIDYENFIEIVPQKINKKQYNYYAGGNSFRFMGVYLDNEYIVKYTTFDLDEQNNCANILEEFEALTIAEPGRVHSFTAVNNMVSGVRTARAHEFSTNPKYPDIPMDTIVYNREIIFSPDGTVKEYCTDTVIKETAGGCQHIVEFSSDDSDPNINYRITMDIDENCRIIHMYDSNTNEDQTMSYNDQGLMIERITVKKASAPKKILFKGAAPDPATKDIVHVEHFTYTEDGKPLLIATHNDLMCNFEAFEYDEKGREIFNATFSTYSE